MLIPDDVLGPTGRRDWILRPIMGSDYNFGLDYQTLGGQTLDGRTLQEHVGFPLNGNTLTYSYPRVSYHDILHDSVIYMCMTTPNLSSP